MPSRRAALRRENIAFPGHFLAISLRRKAARWNARNRPVAGAPSRMTKRPAPLPSLRRLEAQVMLFCFTKLKGLEGPLPIMGRRPVAASGGSVRTLTLEPSTAARVPSSCALTGSPAATASNSCFSWCWAIWY